MHTALAARRPAATAARTAFRHGEAPCAAGPRTTHTPDTAREDEAWLAAKLRDTALFETPWEGDAQLIPIRTTRSLRDASAVFANRMWDRLDWFLDGQEACFMWKGPEKAAVTLRTDPMFGWTLREITGQGGQPVSAVTESEIVARFAAMGFRCRAAFAA